MNNTVSVVMITYHTGPALLESIPLVLAQENLQELVLINNGNPPEEEERLKKLAAENPKVKFITGHGNIGFAAGCNLGVKNAVGEYVLLLNPDCLLPENCFNKIIEELNNHKNAWVAGCRLLNIDGTEQVGGRRNLLTLWLAFVESFNLYILFPGLKRMNLHDKPVPDNTIEMPAISGAFMFMKREIYNKLGGMDEGYFLHVEDMDFCYQVNKAGGRLIYIPSVEVKHYLSTSGEASSEFIERHKANGFIRYFEKNFKDKYPAFILKTFYMLIKLRLVLKIVAGKYLRKAKHK
jgi:GT2 family glycosyltransferase